MSAYWSRFYPQDIMEHLQELYVWWYCKEEAKEKLMLVAEHIDDPQKLLELEEEWLHGRKPRTNEDLWGDLNEPWFKKKAPQGECD